MKRLPNAEAVALRRYDQIMLAQEQAAIGYPHTRVVKAALQDAANYVGIPLEELQTLIGKRERAG